MKTLAELLNAQTAAESAYFNKQSKATENALNKANAALYDFEAMRTTAKDSHGGEYVSDAAGNAIKDADGFVTYVNVIL